MRKKVFLFLLTALTAVVLAAVVSAAVGKGRTWPSTPAEYESAITDALPRDAAGAVFGTAVRILQPDALTANGETVVREANDFLIPFHMINGFDTDQAVENIGKLKEYCAGLGIPLLYASFPSKETYTETNPEDYGVLSDGKQQRTLFLNRIRDLGIPLLDLADVFRGRGFTQEDVFYRTDHHWKTRMGLIAAGELAGFLSDHCGAVFHPELLEEERYRTTVYERKWLGETGREVSPVWAGELEDYVLYEPDFETALEYYVPSAKISRAGDFGELIKRELLEGETDLYKDSLHYAYMKDSGVVVQIRNKKQSGAKILLIKDSFSVPVAPFLSLACGNLFWWDMRDNNDIVTAYIDKHRFDAVIIAYTDFWRDEMYDFR